MKQVRPPVVAFSAHARRVPRADRERFSRQIAATALGGGVVIETCHRVELYVAAGHEGADELARSMPPRVEMLQGGEAARHAIAVAVGLDSVVLGEGQILHQLRESVAAARRERRLDSILDRLFSLAMRAGRRARSWQQGPAPSLADAALLALERSAGPLGGRSVLVVGAGEMGRRAAIAATAAGATVTIASRTPMHAETLAGKVGAAAAPLDPGTGIGDFAGIIVALRGPWTLAASTSDRLAGGSVSVVDLSVPPAVAVALARALRGRYVSADDLATREPPPLRADRNAARLARLVDATLDEFAAWVAGGSRRAAAAAIAERAESERRAELHELWRRMPELDPDARAAIAAMSEHLAARLLREPLERLARDVDGRAESAARELFAL